MKYNRKEPNDNSNILITLILAYSNPFQILQKKFDDYIDVLSKEIDFNEKKTISNKIFCKIYFKKY